MQKLLLRRRRKHRTRVRLGMRLRLGLLRRRHMVRLQRRCEVRIRRTRRRRGRNRCTGVRKDEAIPRLPERVLHASRRGVGRLGRSRDARRRRCWGRRSIVRLRCRGLAGDRGGRGRGEMRGERLVWILILMLIMIVIVVITLILSLRRRNVRKSLRRLWSTGRRPRIVTRGRIDAMRPPRIVKRHLIRLLEWTNEI